MTRVYIAGAMGGRMGWEVINERKDAVELCRSFDLLPYDPAYGENVDPSKPVDLQLDYLTMKAFVAKDEHAVRNSDVVLVLTGDCTSSGTSWEMGLAHFECHIPVVVVSPKRVAGELMDFTNIKADAIFSTVEEAVEFIAENYGGN
jgi:nucleoside 2-deoxyribosyltransferase